MLSGENSTAPKTDKDKAKKRQLSISNFKAEEN